MDFDWYWNLDSQKITKSAIYTGFHRYLNNHFSIDINLICPVKVRMKNLEFLKDYSPNKQMFRILGLKSRQSKVLERLNITDLSGYTSSYFSLTTVIKSPNNVSNENFLSRRTTQLTNKSFVLIHAAVQNFEELVYSLSSFDIQTFNSQLPPLRIPPSKSR